MTENNNKANNTKDVKVEAIAKDQMKEGGIWSSSNSSEAIANKPAEGEKQE